MKIIISMNRKQFFKTGRYKRPCSLGGQLSMDNVYPRKILQYIFHFMYVTVTITILWLRFSMPLRNLITVLKINFGIPI
jgi:hypothetical protein